MVKKSPGRPKLTDEEKIKSASLQVRLPSEMKDRLDSSAKSRDDKKWKMNTEIVHRLKTSLSSDVLDNAIKAFGGEKTFYALMMMSEVVQQIEAASQPVAASAKRKGVWLDDPFMYEKVREGIGTIFDQLQPKGKAAPPAKMITPPEYIGEANALGVLAGVSLAEQAFPIDKVDADGNATRFSDQKKRYPLIKNALGEDVVSRIGRKR